VGAGGVEGEGGGFGVGAGWRDGDEGVGGFVVRK